MNVENPMVKYKYTDEVKVGKCYSCKMPIYSKDECFEVEDGLIHDDWECAYKYINLIYERVEA